MTRKHDLNFIIVNGSLFVSDWLIMSSVLLRIPFFMSLNNQIRNTFEMGVYSSQQ